MAYRATFVLHSERDRGFALAAVMRAPIGMAVAISHPKRTNDQNRRMWGMLQAIADSDLTFAGERLEPEEWKDVLGSAWRKANGRESGRLRRGLEGEPVLLGSFQSSALTTKEFAEFSESVLAFIDTNGIKWLEREEPPPPTEAI